MAERHIDQRPWEVQAILAGRKSQTRRVLPAAHPKFPKYNVLDPKTMEPELWYWDGVHDRVGASLLVPYAVGDRLWVREAWCQIPATAYALPKTVNPSDPDMAAYYRADFDRSGKPSWRSPIHMPRWVSRLTLTVTDVRVQRVQDISEADAIAEAPPEPSFRLTRHQIAQRGTSNIGNGVRDDFRALWHHLHGPGSWDANPWVTATTFTAERRNIDGGG